MSAAIYKVIVCIDRNTQQHGFIQQEVTLIRLGNGKWKAEGISHPDSLARDLQGDAVAIADMLGSICREAIQHVEDKVLP